MKDFPKLIEHRRNGAKAAIVLIHGFGGNAETTWGGFPALLKANPLLVNWDVYSIGYSTTLSFDVAGLWSADPEIITLGGLLETVTDVAPIKGYRGLALVAHSMGGLVLQRALLSSEDLRARTSHVLLFGTPSAGLTKASPFKFWKRQINNMAAGSEFVTSLRADWASIIGDTPHFQFLSAAGDRDEFVPTTSSLDPFSKGHRRVVYGDHLQIVKPENTDHLGFKVAVELLTGGIPALGVFDSALRAVESREFQQAIDRLWPIRTELDDRGLVTLALALESTGRQGDAIDVLSSAKGTGTDPLGVLAGRLKRRWLLDHRKADAEKALEFYRAGLDRSSSTSAAPGGPAWSQAFYHAINCAFMELAFREDRAAAKEFAGRALEYCAKSEQRDIWRYATEGEAHLYLGDESRSVEAYAQATALHPKPREAASMYQQAVRAADLMDRDELVAQLALLFGQPAAVSVTGSGSS